MVCADSDIIDALEADGERLDVLERAIGRRIELNAEPDRDRDGFDIVAE